MTLFEKRNDPAMTGKLRMRGGAAKFGQLRNCQDLAVSLRIDAYRLQLLALQPKYNCYSVRKPKGGFRLIEDPQGRLKSVQSRLNDFLQSAYLPLRPECAYGFTRAKSEDDDRTVVGNALRHLGCRYLLNIDLKDFFHQVSDEKIDGVWQTHFRHFDAGLRQLLTGLVCYRQRLPMGAPTSPALSNFASLEMDQHLSGYAHRSCMQYTRYADDLSFSSSEPIGKGEYHDLRLIIRESGFEVNPSKVRWFGDSEAKEITGIELGEDGLRLPGNYLGRLGREIERYRAFFELESRYQTGASGKKLKLFEQELRGKLEFARQVLTEDDPEWRKLAEAFEQAQFALEDFESVDWLDCPYLY